MAEIKQYLITRIKDERFAFNISYIERIVRDLKVTKVPNKIDYLEGVINVRNKVIPLINLRQKLFLNDKYDKDYVVIVTNDGTGTLLGLIVDEVQEVISLSDSLIDNPLLFKSGFGQKIVDGIGKLESGLVIILNVLNLLTDEEKETVSTTMKKVEKNKSAS